MEFKNRKIIIYGTGMVGNLVRRYFEIVGISKYIVAFSNSNSTINELFYGYKNVIINDLIEYKEECDVLIATFPVSQTNIEEKLKFLKFNRIIKMDFEMYQHMTKVYISDFAYKKKYENTYDVLYMASDNNKTSGAFLCLVELAKDMNKKGIKTIIILPEYGDGEDLLLESNIDYTFVPSMTWLKKFDEKQTTWQEQNIVDNDKAILEICNLIDKYNIKLVHCNTTYTNIGAIAAHYKNIPIIWHIREKIDEQGYGYLDKNEFYNLVNNSERIITVSDFIKKSYPELEHNKTITIYDGIDTKKYYSRCGIFNENKVRILMPAAIYPLKRQEDLINAAILLRDKKISFSIDLIGAAEEKYFNKLQKIVYENKLASYINCLGKIDDINKYYKKSDIVVICSGVEAFGRVCVEAFLAGCLVIGAKSGATVELIRDKDTGLLYEYKNHIDLARKIEYAINNINEMKMIALNGQKVALSAFNKEITSNKIYDIYKELI